MKTYHSSELRSMFLKFFKDHGHAVISSASVIPENDPTVLFTTAGMHPLVPYLMGAKHPAGKRLTDVQKCVRTGDIDDVGDFSHLTFFEMLGNWSLGDYFKEQMIPWSWEFLTSPEYLGLPKDRLAFSVFAGDADCPRDEESAQLWRHCGVADDHSSVSYTHLLPFVRGCARYRICPTLSRGAKRGSRTNARLPLSCIRERMDC